MLKQAVVCNCLLSFFQELKLGVCGSQIVGLVPLEAMLLAADYYIEKENLFILSEDQKIRLVCMCQLSYSNLKNDPPSDVGNQ